MKILINSQGSLSDNYGGGQVYIRNLIAGLLANNHDVEYLSLAFSNIALPQVNELSLHGVVNRELVMPISWGDKNSAQYAMAIAELGAAYRDNAPDIIHAHGAKELACLAADRAAIPCIVTAHHGGIVCPAGTLLNQHDEICAVPAEQTTCLPCCVRSIPCGKLWSFLLSRIPLAVQIRFGKWLRARRFLYLVTPLGTLALSIRDKLVAIDTLGRYATRIIAPSISSRNALVRNGIPVGKVVVIPHGIPLPQRQPLCTSLHEGLMRFLYVGRICYVKGVHVMLEAFSGLPPQSYELHIVGGSVTKKEQCYLTRLQQRYASLNVIWHGSRPHKEIPLHIAACDVMVHPAICLEVFGLTIAESLAVGRPVIASRCGGAEAQIRDGENGLLVPPNDAIAMRRKIQSMIDDPTSLQNMAKQTEGVISLENHGRELEKVYLEAINDGKRKGWIA